MMTRYRSHRSTGHGRLPARLRAGCRLLSVACALPALIAGAGIRTAIAAPEASSGEQRFRAIASPALSVLRGLAPEVRTAMVEWTAMRGGPRDAAGRPALPAGDARIDLVLRFAEPPGAGDLDACGAAGLEFDRLPSGEIAHVGTIYSGRIEADRLAALAAIPGVEELDTKWRPGAQRPLDLSAPEVQADQVWTRLDAGQHPIRGQGVVIADLDTGIDVFHPGFFRDDGGSFSWLDTNTNGQFDPGTDAIDLDGNGTAGANEKLRFIDGAVYDDPMSQGALFLNGIYDADRDWLYNDANNDGARNYGRGQGFTDASPCFGEPFFLTADANGNARLDPGESLVMLKTSKVKAVFNPKTDQAWTRGSNLIDCEADANGHGTGVCGILAQDTPGRGRKLVGLAPDAELVVANIFSGIDIASAVEHTKVMSWARNQGAKIFLWEIGAITFDYADGSSLWEQAVNQSAAEGIVQVCPAGNYAGGGKHASANLAAGGSVDLPMKIPTALEDPYHGTIRYWFGSVVWRGSANEIGLEMRSPTGSSVTIPASPAEGTLSLGTDGFVYYYRGQSTRGTSAIFLMLYKGAQGGDPLATGVWRVEATNSAGAPREVGFWSVDDVSSWAYGAVWQSHLVDASTIDLPATADSAIAVASYSTRGYGVNTGGLSTFSGRGPRVDGMEVMDIAAPGNYDVYSARSKDAYQSTQATYTSFGGTSAAGPHVAAVSALLVQAAPDAGHAGVARALRAGAASDAFTGAVPNENWGAGKLRALEALEAVSGGGGATAGDANVDGSVNVLDLVSIVNHILEVHLLTGQALQNADANHDSQITILDVVAVVNIILGKANDLARIAAIGEADADGAALGAEAALRVKGAPSSGGISLDFAWDDARPIAIDVEIRTSGGRIAPGPIPAACVGSAGWQAHANLLQDGTLRVIGFCLNPASEDREVRIDLALRGGTTVLEWVRGTAATSAATILPLATGGFPLRIDLEGDESDRSAGSGALRVTPNPARETAEIRLGRRADTGDRARVRVWDVAGALVRALDVPAGADHVFWDGCDDRGRRRPSGVYFVRVESEVDGFDRRIARLYLLR